jgi:hypothetical protein
MFHSLHDLSDLRHVKLLSDSALRVWTRRERNTVRNHFHPGFETGFYAFIAAIIVLALALFLNNSLARTTALHRSEIPVLATHAPRSGLRVPVEMAGLR